MSLKKGMLYCKNCLIEYGELTEMVDDEIFLCRCPRCREDENTIAVSRVPGFLYNSHKNIKKLLKEIEV